MLISIGTVLLFCTTFYYRSNANYWQKQVGQYHSEETKILERKLHKAEEHSRTLEHEVGMHKNHNHKLVDDHKTQQDVMWHDHEVDDHVEEKLSNLWNRVDDLREHVQSFSRRSVLDR
jgi:exonuclease VII large subunit